MKKIYIGIITVLFFSSSLFAQDVWVQKDSVNGPPRSAVASFVLKGEGFVVGGLDLINFKRKMYSYDVDQDDWDAEESIGGVNGSGLNRGGAIAFSSNDKGYVGLGQGNTAPFYSDLWEYDPINAIWTQKADFIGSARRHAVSFTINDITYVGTGQDQNGFTNDFYKYDSELNEWTQLNDFGGTARKGAVGYTMGAQGYVGTGDDGIYKNDFWQYEPTTDLWIQKASFPGTARTGACGWGVFPTAFIACGYDNAFNYKKDVWEYNYFADVWVQRTNFLGSKRTNATAFVIDGIAYLGLGYNGAYLDDFYAYTPILSIHSTDDLNAKISTFPNPTTNYLTITISQSINSSFKAVIYNLQGQIVLENNFIKGENSLKLNLESITKGIYIVDIVSQDGLIKFSKKITKQ